jgi:hypothetical protein
MAMFTFFVLPVFVLSGCDVISEFLGLGGGTEEQDNPGSGGQEPTDKEPSPLAEGGEPALIIPKGDGTFYEAHTFPAAETYTLSFFDTTTSVTTDYLIVAGGGGAGQGANSDRAGGRGAGGVLYKTGQSLEMTDGAISIIVGAGGSVNGGNGGNSVMGSIAVPGGGGGINGYNGDLTGSPGRNGGSGGGGVASTNNSYSLGGYGKRRTGTTGVGADDPPVDDEVMGNNGGNGETGTNGGGSGGAGSAGLDGDNGSADGDPWVPGEDAVWIQTVTGTSEFSRG